MAALSVAAIGSPAHAGTITGHVYVDEDGDGVFSPQTDSPVPGVTLAIDTASFAVTDAKGAFRIPLHKRSGILWARTPDGFEPGPPWIRVDGTSSEVDLAFEPSPVLGPVTFSIASDSHLGRNEYGSSMADELDGADFALALSQAVDLEPRPHFFVIVGDIVQSNEASGYDDVLAVERDLRVPFVPVPGNHDWFDGGATYRAILGPPMYSFDSGGVRFVVLNDNDLVANYQTFLARDLADAGDRVVVAFMHRPPGDTTLWALEAAGVDYLLTGHWHSNESFSVGNLLELSTEPIIRGGMDTTPAGYRIATLVDDRLQFLHGSVVERAHLELAYPRASDCITGGELTVIASAHASATQPEVMLSLDGQAEVAMVPAGGWAHLARVSLGVAPRHTVSVRVGALERTQQVFVCDPPRPQQALDWPQLQGTARHLGASPTPIEPPLTTMWARAIGGHVHGGSPVVSGQRVLVSVTDFGGAGGGAVVALDALTGDTLWRFDAAGDIRSSPTVDGDVAVVATLEGVVHGLDVATGDTVWSVDVTEGLAQNVSALKAAPAVANGVVYIGTQARMVALDAATGVEIWRAVPTDEHATLTSYSAAGATDTVVVGAFGRGRGGAVAWDPLTGERLWTLSRADSEGIHAAPIIHGGVVYLGNAKGQVMAYDANNGARLWQTSLYEGSTNWDYGLVGTPALHQGTLFVPGQYDRLFAVDATSGQVGWSIAAESSVLHLSHARAVAHAFSAAPVVTGETLWVAGADGTLRAVALDTGEERWRTVLDSPITAGPAPAGELLFVGSFGGVVYALHASEPWLGPGHTLGADSERTVPAPIETDDTGCRLAHSRDLPLTLALVLLILVRRRRR